MWTTKSLLTDFCDVTGVRFPITKPYYCLKLIVNVLSRFHRGVLFVYLILMRKRFEKRVLKVIAKESRLNSHKNK